MYIHVSWELMDFVRGIYIVGGETLKNTVCMYICTCRLYF